MVKLESPYKKAKKAGIKSKKTRRKITTDRSGKQSEEIWDMSGPRDAFEAHPLAIKAQGFLSSQKK